MMTKRFRQRLDSTILLFLALIGMTACTTLFRGVVTLTEVVHSAENQYAVLYKQGLVSEETHAKVTRAHDEYRAAAKTGAEALKAYKASGNEADYVAALNATKAAATVFIDRIVPLLIDSRGTKLKSDLQKASEL